MSVKIKNENNLKHCDAGCPPRPPGGILSENPMRGTAAATNPGKFS